LCVQIYLYFNCPPTSGLHCPNNTAKALVTKAIQQGDIYWQAFPHDAELDLLNREMLKFGVQMTHDLDDLFNVVSCHVW
jgi:hypothetical protein